MRRLLLFCLFIFLSDFSYGQDEIDTGKTQLLSPIVVVDQEPRNSLSKLPPISGTYIFSGKKTEIISIKSLDANLTEKTARQIFAKVPGIFVYEMDGAGNQMHIASRGLDPHRAWEFNNRKDGIVTNSDMYAYPASHYSVPLESVERIELVRGTGSLQFGAQFGGMLNYITKQPDTSKKIHFESFNTLGSFKSLSTYNAVGGKIGKVSYYAYVAMRSKGGYRANEQSIYDAENAVLNYQVNSRLSLRAEWARSHYNYRIPGPLTDSMFLADPRQATRSRNYYSPTINVPSIRLTWRIADRTHLELSSSRLTGARNSVLFDKPATVKDSINALTNQFNPRQVDIDKFNSYTNEMRVLKAYRLGKQMSHLTFGVQSMHNNLHRRQQGRGTSGSDYDLSLTNPTWGRDIHLKTTNTAVFAENNFKITERFSFNAGARYENGQSKMSGTIVYYPSEKVPLVLHRNFFLFGASGSFIMNENMELYAGISQAYRPIIFKDLIPTESFERVDPDIKDARGFNAEFGVRGKFRFFSWDITGFALQYNHRFGLLLQTDDGVNFFTYRTNIGNSITKGIEMLVQGNWKLWRWLVLNVFTSTSFMDGTYTSGMVRSGQGNVNIKGNKIESVPEIISRNGLTFQYKNISLTSLYSYTSETYADALNTVNPSLNSGVGLVPAYGVLDLNVTVKISEQMTLRANLNNILDEQYFTKRPLLYPGPGVWPSDGRNGSVSFVLRI